ncbi:NYN domain-containing protein, partial [Nostocoides japonicum]|uniref:NYN domain-containing protein n=1 Tax=Nostocoides japonicum TaxID=99481 RepID=UPI0012F7BA50
MTSRCALYVDAGYLLASSATRVTGSSLRGSVNVDYGSLVDRLVQQAQELSGLPVLRVNWYDSGGRPGGQADHDQEVLGMLPRVKLRLGRRSPNGEQKGVDVRLGLDLATHGRNHVADVMFLVSGDDDLTEAVEEAQGHGVQVVLLAVPDVNGKAHAVARHLVREADGVELIHGETIDATVHRPVPPPIRPDAAAADRAA